MILPGIALLKGLGKMTGTTLTKVVQFSPETLDAVKQLASALADLKLVLAEGMEEITQLATEIRVNLRAELENGNGYEVEETPERMRFPDAPESA